MMFLILEGGGGGGPIKPEKLSTLDPNEGERSDPQKSKKPSFFHGFLIFYKPVVARTGSAESKARVMESFGKYKESEAERKLLYLRPRHGFAASLRGFAPRYSKNQ